MSRRIVLIAALAAGAGAAQWSPCVHAAAAADRPLEVEYGGCRSLTAEQRCIVAPGAELRLWISAPLEARVEIAQAGSPLAGATRAAAEIQGGRRYEVELATLDAPLVVRVHGAGTARDWSLALAPDTESARLRQAWDAFHSGDLDRAGALLDALATPESGALGLRGRIENLRGDTQAARANLRAAVAQDLAFGRELTALQEATVLAYGLAVTDRQFTQARAVLTGFGDGPEAPAEQRYYLDYFRGLIAYNAGEDRSALRALSAAADQAERMGWARLQLSAEQPLAVQLQLLGRRREAAALLAPWQHRLDVLRNDCERAMFLNNVGWTRLLALEAGEPAADPLPPLEQAYAYFSSPAASGLCNADEQVNGLLNLTLAQLHAGHLDRAEQYLARAHATTDKPALPMVLWSLDLEARIQLLHGQAQESLATAERLRALGAATLSPDAVWRAVVRKALAYVQLGRPDDALAAFAGAERLLDEQLFRVPVNEGRETVLAAHAWATQRYVALLLENGRVDEAFALARHAGSRALRSLRPAERVQHLDPAARARWEDSMARYLALRERITTLAQGGWLVPRDELERVTALRAQRERELGSVLDDALAALGPPQAPRAAAVVPEGTLELAFQQVPTGWVTFAANAQGVRAHAVDCVEPATLASCLLAPVAPAIARAARVRVLTGDALRDVDFHAADVDGEPLLAHVPVIYGLDLQTAEHGARDDAGAVARRALVVGDAQGNLTAAQDELRSVRDALDGSTQGWRIMVMSGPDAVLDAVRRQLTDADLFHYAGHARFLGARGWDSELQLGQRTTLDVSDILALAHAPAFVVLSGCETAMTSAAAEDAGIGLAQAFVASGSQRVLAATRPVRDSAALAVMQDFYAAWLGGAAPEVALQQAQLALRRAHADADWSAFRLITR